LILHGRIASKIKGFRMLQQGKEYFGKAGAAKPHLLSQNGAVSP